MFRRMYGSSNMSDDHDHSRASQAHTSPDRVVSRLSEWLEQLFHVGNVACKPTERLMDRWTLMHAPTDLWCWGGVRTGLRASSPSSMMRSRRLNILILTLFVVGIVRSASSFTTPAPTRPMARGSLSRQRACHPHLEGSRRRGCRDHSLHALLAVSGGGGGTGVGGGGGMTGGGGSGGWEGYGGSGGESHGVVLAVVAALSSLWRQYSGLLEKRPVLTKAITAGIIALVGDAVAQMFEHWLHNRKRSEEDGPAESFVLEPMRSLAVLIEGLLFTGPGLHFIYSSLENWWPSQSGTMASIAHLLADELVFDPIFVLGFFLLCGLLEGQDLHKEVIPNIKQEYWSALKGGWAVSVLFLPIEFSTFRYLPLSMRVLVVNLTDVVWTAVVSFFSHLEERRKVHRRAFDAHAQSVAAAHKAAAFVMPHPATAVQGLVGVEWPEEEHVARNPRAVPVMASVAERGQQQQPALHKPHTALQLVRAGARRDARGGL